MTCPVRYEAVSLTTMGSLAAAVLVGVEHIPTRWFVQAQHEGWLGIGASTHWNAMASFHNRESANDTCLHPRDAQDNLIPTVAFVSFWSGLQLASYFVRYAGGKSLNPMAQQTFMTPLRSESIWRAPVGRRPQCSLCWDRGSSETQLLPKAG